MPKNTKKKESSHARQNRLSGKTTAKSVTNQAPKKKKTKSQLQNHNKIY